MTAPAHRCTGAAISGRIAVVGAPDIAPVPDDSSPSPNPPYWGVVNVYTTDANRSAWTLSSVLHAEDAATGRYDPLNMCEGDVIATATLPADLAHRITNTCYESGHIIFRDDVARRPFLRDVSAFIANTAPGEHR